MERTGRLRLLGNGGLLLATVLWGISFCVIKDSLDRIPVLYLMGTRYLLASLGMGLLFWRRLRRTRPELLKDGAWLGFLLFAAQYFQTLGCKYTTAGKTAFITALYVVLVPLLGWGMEKRRPSGRSFFAAGMAVAGLALLSLQGGEGVQAGDGIVLLCSVLLAVHIIYIDRFNRTQDAILLTFWQFFFANLYAWFVTCAARVPFPEELFAPEIGWKILYLGIFSTMCGFLLQIVCQRYTDPDQAAVLLAMESVFGMLFSVLLLGETMTLRTFAGCALMFAAVVLASRKSG